VATISRLLKIIGLLCKRALLKRPYSANETYNFEEPTNRSHPIATVPSLLLATVNELENFVLLLHSIYMHSQKPALQ